MFLNQCYKIIATTIQYSKFKFKLPYFTDLIIITCNQCHPYSLPLKNVTPENKMYNQLVFIIVANSCPCTLLCFIIAISTFLYMYINIIFINVECV